MGICALSILLGMHIAVDSWAEVLAPLHSVEFAQQWAPHVYKRMRPDPPWPRRLHPPQTQMLGGFVVFDQLGTRVNQKGSRVPSFGIHAEEALRSASLFW